MISDIVVEASPRNLEEKVIGRHAMITTWRKPFDAGVLPGLLSGYFPAKFEPWIQKAHVNVSRP